MIGPVEAGPDGSLRRDGRVGCFCVLLEVGRLRRRLGEDLLRRHRGAERIRILVVLVCRRLMPEGKEPEGALRLIERVDDGLGPH